MENKHSNNNLLSGPKITSGFSVENEYFNSIEDSFYCKILEENLPKSHGFKTPPQYFDFIEDNILSKTKKFPAQTFFQKVRQLIPTIAAASVLLFIALNYFTFGSKAITFDEITAIDIENWYENGYGTVDSDEIATTLEQSDFNDDNFLNSTKDHDIETYLENINTTTLIDEIR
ncbi:hypothetical protein [Tenacibaculum maritimum]|uniref:hypothetical protein n=1 Tax=Tenacibaculum maritimum TaxID=107401 RepID=UPI00387604BB